MVGVWLLERQGRTERKIQHCIASQVTPGHPQHTQLVFKAPQTCSFILYHHGHSAPWNFTAATWECAQKGPGEEGTRKIGRWEKDLRWKISPVAAQSQGELRDFPSEEKQCSPPPGRAPGAQEGTGELLIPQLLCPPQPTLPALPGVLPEPGAHLSPFTLGKGGDVSPDQLGCKVTSDPNSSCFPGPGLAGGNRQQAHKELNPTENWTAPAGGVLWGGRGALLQGGENCPGFAALGL